MTPRVALLIEDDRLSAAVLRDWLEEAGWEVVHVPSGADALRAFAQHRPAVVLSDLVLPGVDGTTLCSEIRLQPFGERVLIVLFSARAEARAAALAAGADAFLAKPIQEADLAAALAAPRAPPLPGPTAPAPVRVPFAKVLGAESPADPQEEGAVAPGWLLPLLRRLLAERFTGVLEADGLAPEGGQVRARFFFSRGVPAAARSSEPSTELGRVFERLGLLAPGVLEEGAAQGRLAGLPLGEVLLRANLVDRDAVERALREQVLLRAVGVGRLLEGRWVLSRAEPIGLAGFDVHPAAIAWRHGGPAAALSPDDLDLFVQIDLPARLWPLLDPDGRLGVVRTLLEGGVTARDAIRMGGADVGALVAHLRDWGLATLGADPPPAHVRESALADLEVDDLAARVAARWRVLADANHYLVLGVQPEADAEDIAAATVTSLAEHHPDALPPGLDAESRRRAREIYDRVLEAGRVLGDRQRRAVYDARLAGDAQLRVGDIGHEDHAVLQAERARELFRRGEFVTAAALFHMAILLEGEDPDILAMLGRARRSACPGDPAAGEAELRRALELDPRNEFAGASLARLLADRGEGDEARLLLRRTLSADPDADLAREMLAELDR